MLHVVCLLFVVHGHACCVCSGGTTGHVVVVVVDMFLCAWVGGWGMLCVVCCACFVSVMLCGEVCRVCSVCFVACVVHVACALGRVL